MCSVCVGGYVVCVGGMQCEGVCAVWGHVVCVCVQCRPHPDPYHRNDNLALEGQVYEVVPSPGEGS